MGKREKRILKSLGFAIFKVFGAVSSVLVASSLVGVTWHDLGQPAVVIPAAYAGMNALWSILGSSPIAEMRSPEES